LRRFLRFTRVVAAVDLGVAVNPDVVMAQIEGSIGFALSMVLRYAAKRHRPAEQFRRLRADPHTRNAQGRSAHPDRHLGAGLVAGRIGDRERGRGSNVQAAPHPSARVDDAIRLTPCWSRAIGYPPGKQARYGRVA